MEYVWVEQDKNIKSIVNEEMKLYIKWSKKPDEDYTKLSRNYMNAGYITLKEIIEGPHNNNIKYDMWFLPSIYMMRQAIELLIKSGIAINGATKNELQTIFIAKKHNVKELYKTYKESYGVDGLNEAEQTWLEKYLDSIELLDSNSDLFRYPFKDDFMQQYGDKALWLVNIKSDNFYKVSNRYSIGVR